MPRKKRILFNGAFYHAYNRGVNKEPIVIDDQDRRTFFSLLSEAASEYRVRIFSYCLMNNHFHLYLQTPEANLDKFMWHLQSHHGRHMNQRYERIGPFFQNRYKAQLVQTDLYSFRLMRYIHQNPLRAGMIRNLDEYPWSSYLSYVGKLPRWAWLNTEWFMNQIDKDADKSKRIFIEKHQIVLSDSEVGEIKKKRQLIKERAFMLNGAAPL